MRRVGGVISESALRIGAQRLVNLRMKLTWGSEAGI